LLDFTDCALYFEAELSPEVEQLMHRAAECYGEPEAELALLRAFLHAPEPTYRGIKVSLDAGKASSYRDWVAQIEDAGIRERLRLWLIEHRKIGITTMVVPEQVADRIGIPQELVLGMNLRKLVYTTMSTFYLELEPFGFYFLNQNLTRLVSDHY
jgi:hypothetical protein